MHAFIHLFKKTSTQLLLREKPSPAPQEYGDEQNTVPAQSINWTSWTSEERIKCRGLGTLAEEKRKILRHFRDEAPNSAWRTKVGFPEEVMPEY